MSLLLTGNCKLSVPSTVSVISISFFFHFCRTKTSIRRSRYDKEMDVADLAEVLPPMSFVLAGRCRRRYQYGCATRSRNASCQIFPPLFVLAKIHKNIQYEVSAGEKSSNGPICAVKLLQQLTSVWHFAICAGSHENRPSGRQASFKKSAFEISGCHYGRVRKQTSKAHNFTLDKYFFERFFLLCIREM